MDRVITNLIFILICLWSYLCFRSGVYSYCRIQKRSKTFIRKNRKGKKNYWLYSQLHEKCNLGYLYYGNLIFLIVFAIYMFLLMFSWISWMRIPVILTALLLGIIQIPNTFYAMQYSNRETIGKPFAFFKVYYCNNGSRNFITVLDWFACVFPLGIYIFFLAYDAI